MALIKCQSCDNNISDEALYCPKCCAISSFDKDSKNSIAFNNIRGHQLDNNVVRKVMLLGSLALLPFSITYSLIENNRYQNRMIAEQKIALQRQEANRISSALYSWRPLTDRYAQVLSRDKHGYSNYELETLNDDLETINIIIENRKPGIVAYSTRAKIKSFIHGITNDVISEYKIILNICEDMNAPLSDKEAYHCAMNYIHLASYLLDSKSSSDNQVDNTQYAELDEYYEKALKLALKIKDNGFKFPFIKGSNRYSAQGISLFYSAIAEYKSQKQDLNGALKFYNLAIENNPSDSQGLHIGKGNILFSLGYTMSACSEWKIGSDLRNQVDKCP